MGKNWPGDVDTTPKEVIEQLKAQIGVDKSFDLIARVVKIGERESCMFFIDGFAQDDIMFKLLQHLQSIPKEEMPENIEDFSGQFLSYGEVALVDNEEQMIRILFSGIPCLYVGGYDKLIAIDFRTYPARSVEEPPKDRVMRGSRDGFVETLVFNTALIRRRIRSTEFTVELHTVGRSSKTDVAVCYMDDRVERKNLEQIKKKLRDISIDALSMNQESLAECLYTGKWYNPFPKFKYSERPDATAAALLEGNIVLLVDNSPAAMILPTSLFDIIEDADDYNFPPVTGSYLRITRMLIDFFALFLTPVFLLLMSHPEQIPGGLEFLMIKEPIHVPLLLQLLILEFAVDGLRMAAVNTPSMLSTPLSVVAAIVLGDYTVSSGWFNEEIMLYMAFVTIANYSQANFELGYALKFFRLLLLVLTGLFDIGGFVAGVLIAVFAIVGNKTISGHSYIYPLIPFNWSKLKKHILRVSLPESEKMSGQDNRKA
ncbi:MAG: spore germination protein [Lachnospiraceae bacterium]|nr:spore germination protein [Lachnospiraceae bacterium]